MPHSHDDLNISLLQSDPDAFILQCQKIINIFVKRYISTGMFKPEDKDDIVQSINEALINRLPTIRTQYNGKALLQTYVSAIIQNMCFDIYNSGHESAEQVPFPESKQILYNHPEKNVLIEEEIKRFHSIIQLFHKQRSKVLLCLKVHYQLLLTLDDIDSCFPGISDQHAEFLLSSFGANYDEMKVEDMFEILTQVFNLYQAKKTQSDSLRRWTQHKADEIIQLLNGRPVRSAHNDESLKILLEKYSAPQSNL